MNELIDFCLDTENPETNYRLAQWYEKQNHTASAHVYYFRTAERTDNKNLAYTSLLRSSICYKSQGKRDATEKLLIHAALSYLQERPEAYYFLSLFYQRKEEWDQCYLYADFGLKCYENEINPIDLPEYKGKYALIYQKALASWWWGKGEESKKLFQLLKDEHWDVMNDEYRNLVDEKLFTFHQVPKTEKEKNYTKKTTTLDNSILEKYNLNSENFETTSEFDWGVNCSNMNEIIKKEIFEENIYEKFFSVKENDIVMDIGANVGAFSYSILNKKPKHIYCIEPSINLISAIKNNLKGHSVTIINCAVSNENNKSKKPNENVYIYSHEGEYETKTFKSILEENNIDHIDFLKIDCEGGEYDVFNEENKDFILNKVKYIVGEWHFTGIENFLEKFKKFRELYLSNHNNYRVFERCGKEITDKIFDDNYLIGFEQWYRENGDGQLTIYINNDIENNKKQFFSINEYKKSTSWIVDNFYDNPDEIRKFALEQEFGDESVITGFVGRRTFNQFLFPGLKEAFESVMGKKITKWEEYGMNGRFQICWSGERLVYHCDEQMWGGMIYLTPNAPYQCGTTLYADKKNRARTYYDPGWDEYWANTPGDCHLDRTPFEPVDVLGNVYNRLAIFDASCIHSASEYFGTNKENARLWQMFFFDTEK